MFTIIRSACNLIPLSEEDEEAEEEMQEMDSGVTVRRKRVRDCVCVVQVGGGCNYYL